jgi:hypothetical protein
MLGHRYSHKEVGLLTKVIIRIQLMVLFMHLLPPTLDMQAILGVMAQCMAQTMGTKVADLIIFFETINVIIASVLTGPL